MIDLFQRVDFKSHSGLDLTWKIEMDALTPKEWDCISTMILELSPPFKEAKKLGLCDEIKEVY